MLERIGETAGRVWRLLNAEGELSLKTLQEEVGDRAERVTMAVGWLAREDKLDITSRDGELYISLRENAQSW